MTTLLILLTLHFVADFICQSDRMAAGKSKSWPILTEHVAAYSVVVSFGCVVLFWSDNGDDWNGLLPFAWMFALTFATHFVTDAVTSRITSRLWFFRVREGAWRHIDVPSVRGTVKERDRLYNPFVLEGGSRHWFFVAIGADQLIHAYTLAWTAQILGFRQ